MPILVMRPGQVSRFLQDAHCLAGDRGYPVYVGRYHGAAITVVGSGLGCPSVAVAVEELSVAGAHYLIRAGSCASIASDLAIGSLLVATWAVPDEGTSRYYESDGTPSSLLTWG